MRINTNIASLNAQRFLNTTRVALSRALQQLASGKRINSARDDASGLAISTGLEAQVRGLTRGILNINETFGAIETADSAIQAQTETLQRMRELAMQSSNGTLSDKDRGYLNSEFQQLYEEFNRVTSQTQYNGVKLLDGSFATKSIQVGSRAGESIDLSMPSLASSDIFRKRINDGTFDASQSLTVGFGPKAIAMGDLNGDGYSDALVADAAGYLETMMGSGSGVSPTSKTFAAGDTPTDVQLADVNGDGKLDAIVAEAGYSTGTSTISLYLGDGTGTFSSRQTLLTGTEFVSVKVGDVTGDSKVDIVAADSNAGVRILTGSGTGTFTATSTQTMGVGISSVALLDFNGDGLLDIATSDFDDSTVSLRINSGSGSFAARVTQSTGTNPTSLKAADLNGDGHQDLVAANLGDGSVSILFGSGTNTLTPQTALSVGATLRSINLADIDGDGDADLVASMGTNGTLQTYTNSGGVFSIRSTLSATPGENTQVSAFADIDGDGINDLVAVNEGTGSLSYFYGNSQFTSAVGDVSVATQSLAQRSLAILDNAIQSMQASRVTLGAQQNRLEFAASIAALTKENIAEARSQILDTDVAAQTAEMVRLQILEQANVAVLSQANQSLNIVLSLLRF